MFYTFYIGEKCSFEEIKAAVKKNISQITLNDMEIFKEENNQIRFICNWFDLTVRDDSKGIIFISEDYSMELNFLFWFEVNYSVDGMSENKMMELIGNILRSSRGDSILLSNGDKPILERRGEKVVVDDSRLDPKERFPFKYLNMKYEEGKLIQM